MLTINRLEQLKKALFSELMENGAEIDKTWSIIQEEDSGCQKHKIRFF